MAAQGQLLVREFHLGQPRNRADIERPCVDRKTHLCMSNAVGPNNVQFAFDSLDRTKPDDSSSADWPKPSSGVVVSKLEITRALDAGATAIYSDVGLWEAAIAELTQNVANCNINPNCF